MLCFGLLLSCPLLRWARAPLLIALYSIGSLEFGRRAQRPWQAPQGRPVSRIG